MRAWRRRIRMRDVFDVVEQFFEHDDVRTACQQAVGRLPRAEQRVINGYFFEELDIAVIAARSKIANSTVYNQKANAQRRLHDDDVFFVSPHALGAVRDEARARETAARYPDGYLPDGRRIVVIDNRAA